MREGDLEKQRQEAEEKLAAVEKEREAQIAQGQIAVSNALSEVERLTNMCNELTIVSLHHKSLVAHSLLNYVFYYINIKVNGKFNIFFSSMKPFIALLAFWYTISRVKLTTKMAEWLERPPLGFDSKSGQTDDWKIAIHSVSASRLALL